MKYTVLVVEDERDQRRALIERVDWESAGFEVAGEAENGFEALELTETLEPDLIITDIRMPMMTGARTPCASAAAYGADSDIERV